MEEVVAGLPEAAGSLEEEVATGEEEVVVAFPEGVEVLGVGEAVGVGSQLSEALTGSLPTPIFAR